MNIPNQLILSSSESVTFKERRECVVIKPLRCRETGLTFLWVEISPVVIGESLGVREDIDRVVLAPRHVGYYLDEMKEFPIYVYILLAKVDLSETDVISVKDCDNVAWGEINREKSVFQLPEMMKKIMRCIHLKK